MQLPKLEVKMFVIKQLINQVAPRVGAMAEGVNAEHLQSKIIMRVWARLKDVLEKEEKTGVFGDRNFRELVKNAGKVLIFLCENDNYYRRWLGLLIRFIAEEYAKAEAEFSFIDASALPVKPPISTEEDFKRYKPALWECALAGYLHGLSLASKDIVNSVRIALENKGFIDLPSIDEKAYYRLYFDGEKSRAYNLMLKEAFSHGR
jgi:hypothetical protein